MDNSFTTHGDMALNLVDLEKYPIENLEFGDGAKFLKDCQQKMDENGWCNFDGFIKPNALNALEDEATALQSIAETLTIKRNIYQGKVDTSVPKDDPRRREYIHVASQLADDQISESTLIKQLYKSEKLTDFIRRVQRKSALYRCADEFQALNIVALHPGSWHAWHYDTTECTVTLLLKAAKKVVSSLFYPIHEQMKLKIVKLSTNYLQEICPKLKHLAEVQAPSHCFVVVILSMELLKLKVQIPVLPRS